MRFLAAIIFSLVAAIPSAAQDAPKLKHSVAANGDLLITWPVQVIPAGTFQLAPSYQLETATELGRWTPLGAVTHGEIFGDRIGSIRLDGLAARAVTFVRIRAIFDFRGRDFSQRVIQNASLNDFDFTGANFFGTRLDNSAFTNTIFTAADFRLSSMTEIEAPNADFTLARLADTDLTSANLNGVSFLFAELTEADLSFADLRNADMRGAILEDAIITFTRFHGSQIDHTTILDLRARSIWRIVNNQGAGGAFSNMDLAFADLSRGNLTNAQLQSSDLTGSILNSANLTGANLSNANLRAVDLRGTILDDTTIIAPKWRTIWEIINDRKADRNHTSADLSQALWTDVVLERADVGGCNFAFGIFLDANFRDAKAFGANFTNVEFHGADFRNADLGSAVFTDATLEDVNFTGANIAGASFTGATFRNTTMPDGTIRN